MGSNPNPALLGEVDMLHLPDGQVLVAGVKARADEPPRALGEDEQPELPHREVGAPVPVRLVDPPSPPALARALDLSRS